MRIMLRVLFSLVLFSHSWLYSVDHQALLTRWHGSSAAIRVSPVLRFGCLSSIGRSLNLVIVVIKVARAYQLYHI